MPQAASLEIHQLRKQLGRTDIINGVDLTVQPGERVAIIGPNGAGKSTLFHLISGGMRPDAGEILLGGQRIDGQPAHAIHRMGLSRSFQISSVFGQLSVLDNLRCAVLWGLGHRYNVWRRLSRMRDVNERAGQLLEMTGLAARRDVQASELSYAEQRALEIGLTLAGNAGVILLDEPTAGMSQSETERCVQLIRTATEGRTLLMVEHDMGVVFGLADRIAVLVQGAIIAFDTPEAIRANTTVQRAYLGALADESGEAANAAHQ